MKKTILLISLSLSIILSSCGKPSTIKNDANNVNNVENSKTTNTDIDVDVATTKKEEKAPTPPPKTESTSNTDNTKNNTSTETSTKIDPPPKSQVSKGSSDEKDWFFEPKSEGVPSGAPKQIVELINKHSAYYLGDTSQKVIYLTFDEGYENGYSSKILDILKEKNVKAAFFVTNPYINSNKELIKRMVDEGHLVCNHSNTHPSMASVAKKDKNTFSNEFSTVEKSYKNLTGNSMPKFFRPPMGKYSELSLKYTEELGYKTIFWSFAYNDWDPKKQPSEEYAKKYIMQHTHPGAIMLLHAVSKTNTDILPWLIDEWRSKGYEFRTLDELPAKNTTN